jgi:hypothetical protein
MADSNPTTTPVSIPIPKNPAFKNLTGQPFGLWTVLTYSGRRNNQPLWLCRCVCGTERQLSRNILLTNGSQSCGCARGTHKLSGTPEYQAWCSMMARCYVETTERFPNYGGRGILVCERWHSVEAFIADMGQRPPDKTSIDRRDNDLNYEPGNCRWATALDQANNRRSSRFLEHRGERHTLAEWSRITGLKTATISGRLKVGMPVGEALTLKPQRLRRPFRPHTTGVSLPATVGG